MDKPSPPDGGRPPAEFLFSSPGAAPGASEAPPEPAESVAELRRVRERLDALVEELREVRSAEERTDREALAAELRSRLDELSAENERSVEGLLRRFAELEAAVRKHRDARPDEDIVHRLRVAETSLVSLSDTVRGVERRLFERLEPIERAATSVEETTGALEVTAGKLAGVAEANARVLPAIEETRKAVGRLEVLSSVGFFLVLALFLMLFLVLEKRAQLLSELLGTW